MKATTLTLFITSIASFCLTICTTTAFAANGCSALGLKSGQTVQLDMNNGKAWSKGASNIVVSGSGRYVTFTSASPDIIASTASGDRVTPNGKMQVYVMDLKTKNILLSSVASDGISPANADCWLNEASIDRSGARIVFQTDATNLSQGNSRNNTQVYTYYAKAADGKKAGTVILVSRRNNSTTPASGGDSSVASISANAPYVVYKSNAKGITPKMRGGNNYQIIVFNLKTLKNTLVSQNQKGVIANGTTGTPSINATGHFITWPSNATNLVTDIPQKKVWYLFRKDLQTGEIERISNPSDEASIIPDKYCNRAAIQCGSFSPDTSRDGLLIAFDSVVANLDPNIKDANQTNDVFLYNAKSKKITLLSQRKDHAWQNGGSDAPDISANGKRALFRSNALSSNGYYYMDLNTRSLKPILASIGPKNQKLVVGTVADGDMPNMTDDGKLAVFYAKHNKNGDNHIFARCLK